MARTLSGQNISQVIYEVGEVVGQTVENARELGKAVVRATDSFIEYPGSKKGDQGWWRLTEWLDAKADKLLDHSPGRKR